MTSGQCWDYDAIQYAAVHRFLQTALIVDDHAVTAESPAAKDAVGEDAGQHASAADRPARQQQRGDFPAR